MIRLFLIVILFTPLFAFWDNKIVQVEDRINGGYPFVKLSSCGNKVGSTRCEGTYPIYKNTPDGNQVWVQIGDNCAKCYVNSYVPNACPPEQIIENGTGGCVDNPCSDIVDVNGTSHEAVDITDPEICQWDEQSNPTGNIWLESQTCLSNFGRCYTPRTCYPPEGYSDLTNITTAISCNAQVINLDLPVTTNMIIVEAIWQVCDSKCYVKTIDIDCASQTPYIPSLQEGETIYSTDITLSECINYANSQNFDARFEEYKTQEAPGFSCQNLKFCIVKDRPHTCQGIDIPLPTVAIGETYFLVSNSAECTSYATEHDRTTRVVHFDDLDNSGRFCYNVDYCVVSPSPSPADDNGTTGGGDTGTSTGGNENNTTTPDNTGTHDGTGATSIDLNGTNDRLDIIDGHIKDGNQVNRQGFDRNHDDLNRLSQDIKDGADLINRGLNGLSHGIGSVLDHIKNGEINSTGNAFDDSRIVQANNNTTSVLNDIFDYIQDDGNGSMDDLNLSDLNTSQLNEAIAELSGKLDDLNMSKDELKVKMQEELESQMQDFKDKSEEAITTVFDDVLTGLFNPMKPFLDVGQNISNFKRIDLPIVVSSVGYTGQISMSSTDVFGSTSSPLADFYELMRVILSIIAVIGGFWYLIEAVSRG